MANKDWWESFDALDCLKIGSWEDMVDYIQHSSCTDFTIYSTCTDTGQAFKFSQHGTLSQIWGGSSSGNDMVIYANSNNAYPFLKLEGDEGINLEVANDEEILFNEGGAQFFKFDHSTNESFIYGGASTGDEVYLYANSVDAEPYLLLEGDDFAVLDVASNIYFKDQGTQSFKFDYNANISSIYGGAVSGDDLRIYANSSNSCSMIELLGDSHITCKVKAGSVFEVSTCSDEVLFEIDSTSDNHHADFHCLDAVNFVLENRTDDPGSPCTGQIWFRTDLV